MNRTHTALSSSEGISRSPVSTSPLHFLIVEDLPEDVERLVHVLQTAEVKFTYDVASTLDQCRAYFATCAYDLVLADYCLPGLSAPQVFEMLCQFQTDVPFILVTGNLGEEAAVECIKTGMTDYVLKDRLFRLPMVLRRALDESDLRRQQKQALLYIEQQAWRESILNQIVQAMRETLVLDQVLQNTADQLQQALSTGCCLILRPNQQQALQIQYTSRACPLFDSVCQARREAILAHALHSFDLKVVDQDALPVESSSSIDGGHSLLLAPLAYQQRHLGVLCLQRQKCDRTSSNANGSRGQWSENERALVQAVADQCAIAIHQAELYQQAQIELERRRSFEAQLRHEALHDTLTGLPNRALLLDRLGHALELAQRHPAEDRSFQPHDFAVLCLDLDDFKVINDSLSHFAGDQLLTIVAERLTTCLCTGDTLARLGGDEFCILLEEVDTLDTVIDVIDDIQSVLKLPMLLDNTEVFISASIGVVLNTPHYHSPSQLLRDADTAMYRAKRGGPGQYQVFDASMHLQVRRRLKLENMLRRAVERQELWLAYQPIVDLKSGSTRGFEALLRWDNPCHGQVYPTEFIPLAEHTGLITPLGIWVLHQACQQLKAWQSQCPLVTPITMNINLSGKQFSQPNLIEQIDEILQATGLPGSSLKLEVTESVLIENEEIAARALHRFRERDIQICIDDFGTGYSSLSYLHRFPVDVLKIDRSFISGIHTRSENQEIVKAIINLGINLGLDVVAEGIETPEELAFLVDHNCHFGQGFWFAPSLDAFQAEAWLSRQSHFLGLPAQPTAQRSTPSHFTNHLAGEP